MPPRGGLGARLLLAQILVVLVGGATLLVVALGLAPALFREHVTRTVGPITPELAEHLDMAFARAVLVALAVAMVTATVAAEGMEIDVISTPGHSPGHVTYAVRGEAAIFSGDVLFQGSVGRVDLPGGDGPTLLASIATLLDTLPEETVVHPGHMGLTTLGAERATNPFLGSLAR